MITLSNTLTGKKEAFVPLNEKEVGMYNCGPTVYDYVHVGNLRSYVFADILRRILTWNGYNVRQVVNITDLGHLSSDADSGEDKMTKGLKREGKPLTLEAMRELGDFYTERFIENLQDLNIELPTHLPKASDHIKEDIELIQALEHKGFVYRTSDGLYFDTSKDADYGKLGAVELKEDEVHARVAANPEKHNQRDFAVWKFNTDLGYESPWGKGFPGWHIECSAMSMRYLGETFDIHTGGIDHIPVHHNNEIAQSESATGKLYVRYWLHNAFVNVESGKMAKSAGNFVTLNSLKEQNIDPLAYRYWLLTAHYRTQTTFSEEALQAAHNAYKRLRREVSTLPEGGAVHGPAIKQFTAYINDDLDTPKAIAYVWELLKDASISPADKRATLLKFDTVLGLKLGESKTIEIPSEVTELAEKRKTARSQKDWIASDNLREEIKNKGFEIKDTPEGYEITYL